MQRKISFWCLCGIVVLSLLAPGFSSAEENALGDLAMGKTRSGLVKADVKAPKADDESAAAKAAEEDEQQIELEGDEKRISIEEPESMFGKNAVCGVRAAAAPPMSTAPRGVVTRPVASTVAASICDRSRAGSHMGRQHAPAALATRLQASPRPPEPF